MRVHKGCCARPECRVSAGRHLPRPFISSLLYPQQLLTSNTKLVDKFDVLWYNYNEAKRFLPFAQGPGGPLPSRLNWSRYAEICHAGPTILLQGKPANFPAGFTTGSLGAKPFAFA